MTFDLLLDLTALGASVITILGVFIGWYAWIVHLQTENEKDKETKPTGPLLHNIKYLWPPRGWLGMRTGGRNSVFLSYKNEVKGTCSYNLAVDKSNEEQ